MADTSRTITDLLTNLFQDGQPADSITEQDMRDLIVSLRQAFGECDMQSNATATTISVAGTYAKVAGTTSFGSTSSEMDDGGTISNRIRYTGMSTRRFTIEASVSMTTASNNQIVGFKLWHYDDSAASGSYVTNSLSRRKVGTGTDVGSVTIHGDVLLDTNDYIELHITNETSTSAVTAEELYIRAQGAAA